MTTTKFNIFSVPSPRLCSDSTLFLSLTVTSESLRGLLACVDVPDAFTTVTRHVHPHVISAIVGWWLVARIHKHTHTLAVSLALTVHVAM